MIEIDMKLPSCCDECFALDDHGDYPYCLISHVQRGYTFNTRANRMPSCPLKEQEPRVLTIEEVKAYPTDKALWFEACIIVPVLPDCRVEQQYENRLCVEMIDTFYDFPLWFDSYNLDYKFGWRCWSSRPTDEQREAVPWEKQTSNPFLNGNMLDIQKITAITESFLMRFGSGNARNADTR